MQGYTNEGPVLLSLQECMQPSKTRPEFTSLSDSAYSNKVTQIY